MSSGSSRPIERRRTSAWGLASAATGRWVSAAGCWMSESTPPRDTACVMSSQEAATVAAAWKPPRTAKAIMAPGPRIWRPTNPAGSSSPG